MKRSMSQKSSNPRKVDSSLNKQELKPPSEQMQLIKEPKKVISYSLLFLAERLHHHVEKALKNISLVLWVFGAVFLYFILHYIEGPVRTFMNRADQIILWYMYWLVLGILSSIGLGAGLHTFVLFLGPFIAKVTMLAYQCGNVDFETFGIGAFFCNPDGKTMVDFSSIFIKVLLPSLIWGAGTAIGELPPYFLAKAAVSGTDPLLEFKETEKAIKDKKTVSLKDRGLYYASVGLKRYSFIGILLLASIPNPLFDFAGIICGHFGIPFKTFFGATLIGKAVIKSSIQSVVVIAAFSKDFLDNILDFTHVISPRFTLAARKFIDEQRSSFDPNSSNSGGSTSIISTIWNGLIVLMLIYYLVGVMESLANSYVKSKKDKKSKRA